MCVSVRVRSARLLTLIYPSQVFRPFLCQHCVHLHLRHRPRLQRRRLWHRARHLHRRTTLLPCHIPAPHICAPKTPILSCLGFCGSEGHRGAKHPPLPV
ncbi:hypothetical protein A0H81_12424 [Grifola frondosa]|uniref:Uncharacterized protein n=1 Tax=Grifola frondosa TaxID=5627 RepID=A0A1C7LSQ2_GRIFR|nr:hypothetical protein A0H81_12424 [Grifola frondosa]